MAKAPDSLETIARLSSQLAKKSQTVQRLKRLNTGLTAELADSEARIGPGSRWVLVEQSMKLCGVVKVD